jgi:hypothetical protein
MEDSDTIRPDGHRMTARAVTAAWLVLVAATIAGWLLAGGHGAGQAIGQGGGQSGGEGRVAALVVIACAKIYVIMAVFMGLRRAPRGWHMAAVGWILLVGVVIFVLARGATA